MISALNLIEDTDESDVIDTERIRRVELKTDDYSKSIDKGLKYFLSAKTKNFFHRFNLATAFFIYGSFRLVRERRI